MGYLLHRCVIRRRLCAGASARLKRLVGLSVRGFQGCRGCVGDCTAMRRDRNLLPELWLPLPRPGSVFANVASVGRPAFDESPDAPGRATVSTSISNGSRRHSRRVATNSLTQDEPNVLSAERRRNWRLRGAAGEEKPAEAHQSVFRKADPASTIRAARSACSRWESASSRPTANLDR